MRELLQEIGNIMAELSLVAEGKSAGAFDTKITTGEGETGDRPAGPSSTDFDRRLKALMEWLEESRTVLDRARRSPKQKDWRTWVIDTYEGEHYTIVAAKESVHPTYIRKIRVEARREPIEGKRKAA